MYRIRCAWLWKISEKRERDRKKERKRRSVFVIEENRREREMHDECDITTKG